MRETDLTTFECLDCDESFPLDQARTTEDGVKLCPECYRYLCHQNRMIPNADRC